MSKVKTRSWLRAAAAVAVAGLAISACGTVKMGAAAITGSNSISSASLTAEVANLNAAYKANEAKGIKPQRPVGQEAQQVLTWLILFRISDQIAARNQIYVTQAQAKAQLNRLRDQAAANKVTLTEYLTAGAAVPPDLVPQLGQYVAIMSRLAGRITGGKTPATAAEQAQVNSAVAHNECLAAKDLGLTVNPQYGVWDYRTYSVVPAPPTLAAAPAPSATTPPALTKAPC